MQNLQCFVNLSHIQLFQERLSDKVHVTIPKGIVGGFEFLVLQRKLKELARKSMKMCLRVLTESNKRFDTATVVRNSVSIISYITFHDCPVHIFSDNLSQNGCIRSELPGRSSMDGFFPTTPKRTETD